jgi:RHO protein GDP dissociation inhibitor
MEPEVIFRSIGIISGGCSETITTLPIAKNQDRMLFSLKEGSQYRLKLKFTVKHNLVCGLNYVNTVWKKGIRGNVSFSYCNDLCGSKQVLVPSKQHRAVLPFHLGFHSTHVCSSTMLDLIGRNRKSRASDALISS